MPCFHQLTAYRNLDGGKPIFNRDDYRAGDEIRLGCGRCIGCRLRRAGDWGMRIWCEARLHAPNNMFVTRTFDNDHMPDDWSVSVETNQKFIRKMRKAVAPARFRFFTGAEYAPAPKVPRDELELALGRLGRPHYHDCILGYRFPDLKYWSKSPRGDRYYRSKMLEELWPYGHCLIGELNASSGCYTARYVAKKVGGEMAAKHYRFVDPATGAEFQRHPEFALMSRRPGIGVEWLSGYAWQVLTHGFIVDAEGRRHAVPKAFQKKFLEGGPDAWDGEYGLLAAEKRVDALCEMMANPEWEWDNSPERLIVREEVLRAKLRASRVDRTR